MSELIDWTPPYAKNWGNLKILLKAISSYLSKGNFEGELNAWIARPAIPEAPPEGEDPEASGGGLQAERVELVAGTPHCEGSTVGAMIARSQELLITLEYVEAKFILGEQFVEDFGSYERLRERMVGLDNQVLRGEKTKDIALGMMDTLFVAQEVAFKSIKDFYGKEPNEAAFNGVEFMLGNLFNPGVDRQT